MPDLLILLLGRYLPYFVAVFPVFLAFRGKTEAGEYAWIQRLIRIYAAALAARFVFVPVIRYFWPVARPFEAFPDITQIIPHEVTASFPSGHATFFFALATSIWFYDRKMGIWFFFAAVVISIARVLGGVHWPSDIIGGAVLGIATACIISALFRAKTKTTP